MPFVYHRRIYFADTDAAGVVYFANVLSICHEAYEASLAASGTPLADFFRNDQQAVPIIHASVDFRHPLVCGDQILIELTPRLLSESQFEITYEIRFQEVPGKLVATAITRHLCIHPATRTRHPLSETLQQWLGSLHPPT